MNRLCVSIPQELLCYKKNKDENSKKPEKSFKSGVSVVKDNCGKIERVDYYTPCGELLKRVIYNGSSIVAIQHYRNNSLYITEDYKDNLIVAKKIYDKLGKVISKIYYEYDRQNNLTGICKLQDFSQYRIQYGYDELQRVNSRKIWINTEVVEEQKYKYDILDRIIEYSDLNQSILVKKISENNDLLAYTITDKIGNEISITNHLIAGEYIKTEILLNGHSMEIKDYSYLDNIMLKKPYISEDDLELVISNLLKTEIEDKATQRINKNDTTNTIINKSIDTARQSIPLRKSNFGQITLI